MFVAIFKDGNDLSNFKIIRNRSRKKRKIEDMSKRFGDGWKDIFDDFRTDLIKATASTTLHFSTDSYDFWNVSRREEQKGRIVIV